MKTVALVIAEQEFRDEEYQVPYEVLKDAGFNVLTVSTKTTTSVGTLGLEVNPDTLITELKPQQLDALIFIGGGGSEQYFEDPLSHSLLREMLELDKVVGAICIAPVILANAGILRNRRATVYSDGTEILIQKGAQYTAGDVELDGNIITADGPESAQAFGQALVQLLESYSAK